LINSALFSLPDEKDEHQLWIGRRCLGATTDNLKERAVDLRIALMHHPPGWLSDAEQANIKAALKDNCDILMHGHLHAQDVESISLYRHPQAGLDRGYRFVLRST
jgi:predicted phosphodiesterase